MEEENMFRNAIAFLGKLGVYDVILPFLLVFTIMYAILEKTKILGTEEIGGRIYTKKNFNAMVSFVMSFFVVASSKLVGIINQTLSSVVLLLILSVSFLLLVGVFFGSKEFTLENYPGWIKFLMVILFLGIVLIFLNAMGWLKHLRFLIENWNVQWVSTIILLIVVFAFIAYVIWEPKSGGSKKEEKKE